MNLLQYRSLRGAPLLPRCRKTLPLFSQLLLGAAAASTAFGQSPETGPGESLPRPVLEEVFLGGEFHLDLRLRYEFADQSGLDASHASTARTRLGYETNSSLPLSGLIELEDVTALDSDAYNQAGLNDQPTKTVVADPETTEINQAVLRYKTDALAARLGRQRILLDRQRFIGNVGWRQNEQTFDALTLQHQWADGTSLFYGYVNQVNRVLGREHPQGSWDSDSHLFHLNRPFPFGSGGAYAYLLEFNEIPAMSGDTFGVWLRPKFDGETFPINLHLELAYQTDNEESLAGADLGHIYFRSELEAEIAPVTVNAGFERLGGDGTTAFQTPLATLHAFNGWADQFLTTPADGLDDFFLAVKMPLTRKLNGALVGHYFTSHRSDRTYGRELDLLLTRPIGDHVALLAKAALFDGRDGRPDVTKFWLQAELRF